MAFEFYQGGRARARKAGWETVGIWPKGNSRGFVGRGSEQSNIFLLPAEASLCLSLTAWELVT